MGETNLQKRLFTVMMCFGMVFGMTVYNIILHNGLNGELFSILLHEIGIVFAIAFILDLFLVGPFAKKQVFSRVTPETKTIVVVLSISITMVVCMVLLMSVFGAIYTEGLSLNALKIYPKTVGLNFIAALPLNLLIVSPLVRFTHLKIFPPKLA